MFVAISIQRAILLHKVTEYKMCVLIFSTNSAGNISHSKKNRARYDHRYIGLMAAAVILLTLYGNSNWNCVHRLWENAEISSSMKIRPVGAESFHADGQTDMTKQIVAFRNLRTRLKFLRSSHPVCLCVLCGSENKQQLFPYTALTDWFL
jgi:hypothetical protein